MKAVVSNRIYFKYDKPLLERVAKALTYKIESKAMHGRVRVDVLKNYSLHPGCILSIPRGRIDLIPENYEIVDKTVEISVPFPTPLNVLRPEQKEVVDEVDGDVFINAPVGWGKTFAAVHLAYKLGQKTLVVAHNTMLRDQWVVEVEKTFGHAPGIVSSDKYDIEDHFIVIGNVQTVTKKSMELGKEFGTLIVDEAHHTPAATFSSILDFSYAKYKIGLSGTMSRTDGKHVLLTDYFGNHVIKPAQSNTINPIVEIVKTRISMPHEATWAEKVNQILYDPDYQDYVSVLAASKISKGHSVLILADRVEFLENVKSKLGESCLLVTGSVNSSAEEREIVRQKINSGESTSIAGSRQIFSEGISIDRLSCVILATPIANEANLEQIIGRIMRKYPNKPTPLVVDLNFSGYSDRKQNNTRLGLYLKKGWEVIGH